MKKKNDHNNSDATAPPEADHVVSSHQGKNDDANTYHHVETDVLSSSSIDSHAVVTTAPPEADHVVSSHQGKNDDANTYHHVETDVLSPAVSSIISSCSETDGLSDYESSRLKKIVRNKDRLKSLGLDTFMILPPLPQPTPRPRPTPRPIVPRERLQRIAKQVQTNYDWETTEQSRLIDQLVWLMETLQTYFKFNKYCIYIYIYIILSQMNLA